MLKLPLRNLKTCEGCFALTSLCLRSVVRTVIRGCSGLPFLGRTPVSNGNF
jgi:hypothetical protein